MPKKSTKSKSKRVTLRQKYKVLRKVRDHHKKTRKEAKKSGLKKREPKDPGIPSAWPFKEELVQQLAAQKERAAARERKLREESWNREAAQDASPVDAVAELQASATERSAAFQESDDEMDDGPSALVDNSRRAFYRDFAKVVEASDVILEVVDARDPLGCRCVDVERFIRKVDPSKRVVLLLNKVDLVPREIVEAWLKYFREEIATVAFKCSTQQQSGNLSQRALSKAADASLKTSNCLGADILLQLLKNYARNLNLKTSLTVGVIGLPNVGKSSLINSLKRAKVAQVGNTPGVTRSVQEVHLDKQITLLDSPGVVFAEPSADGVAAAALRNCVKVEQLEDPVLPVTEIASRCPTKQLMALYKIPSYASANELLQRVAESRGKLKKGGTVDLQAAARILLQDWNSGKIPYYTVPPVRETIVADSVSLVSKYSAEFSVELALQNERASVIQELPTLESGRGMYFATGSLGAPKADVEAGLDSSNDLEVDDVSDHEMGEDNEAAKTFTRSRRGSRTEQNSKLYEAPGQFNPHAARSERKKQKKTKKMPSGAGSDSDFEF